MYKYRDSMNNYTALKIFLVVFIHLSENYLKVSQKMIIFAFLFAI